MVGAPRRIDGFRLVDARASYGVGLETFALGFPIHFDWAWRTLFNKEWEDALFAIPCGGQFQIETSCGGSSAFRQPRFAVWIGYDSDDALIVAYGPALAALFDTRASVGPLQPAPTFRFAIACHTRRCRQGDRDAVAAEEL